MTDSHHIHTDVTQPSITFCPSNFIGSPSGTSLIVTWPMPTAFDVVGLISTTLMPISSPTSNLNNGSAFPVDLTIVRYTFFDTSFNPSECAFGVSVVGMVLLSLSLCCVCCLPVFQCAS
jgi:hypothetical protein